MHAASEEVLWHLHKSIFLDWFTEVHKYIVLFLSIVPSQLIFLIIDEIDQC